MMLWTLTKALSALRKDARVKPVHTIPRFLLFILVSTVLLGVGGCGARTPETKRGAAIERPAAAVSQSGPPLVSEPADIETFKAFLDRA